MPDWRDEVISAVSAWLAVAGGEGRTARWSTIGSARPDSNAGWYLVDLRGRQVSPDDLDGLQLSPSDGEHREVTYRVMQAVQQGEILRVRVGAHVHRDDLVLRARRQPASFLLERLRDALSALTDPGLADALARGRLTPVPPAPSERELPGRYLGQRQAYAACMTPGLRVVWGPPGTGKTMVLRRAISDLVSSGKRVLLVSSTNVAVDNAVQGVAATGRHRCGELVRVGTPHLDEVANDRCVSLPHLVAARLREAEERRAAVEQWLVAARQVTVRLKQAEKALAPYNHRAYLEARKLLAVEEHTLVAPMKLMQVLTLAFKP